MLARHPGRAVQLRHPTLRLGKGQTPRAEIERQLRALGYVPHTLTPLATAPTAGAAVKASPAPQPAPWYTTGQGRLVVGSGALLAAWALSFAFPVLVAWGYVLTTLVGVGPLARRALAFARLGEPFSINTLVTLAALGALLIGEVAEGAVVVFAVGELLERIAAGRAREGVQALINLTPRTALRLEDGVLREVSATGLRVGERVQARPGARVPADGVIEAGASALDDTRCMRAV